MKSMRIAAAVAATIVVAACATTAAAVGSSTKTVTISVASLIPGSTPAAIQQFNAQVKQFEKANPSIKVKPVEYQWTGPSFAAKLAARTLPTVFEVPFTDARTLGDNGQLADLTPYAKALPYFARAPTRRAGSSRCRRARTPRRCTTTGSSSRRPGSIRTSRPRPGRS
jgi:multiple sugar transport system substrate-binding protein